MIIKVMPIIVKNQVMTLPSYKTEKYFSVSMNKPNGVILKDFLLFLGEIHHVGRKLFVTNNSMEDNNVT